MNGGNTDNQDYLRAMASLSLALAMNRFTMGGNYQRSEDDNVKTADNALGYIKYDHFLTKKWYLYANATGQQDEFQDLNLRATLGVGAGYQFYESERTNLSLEGGLSYVNEDFTIAEDNSYAAARWGLRFDHYILPKSLQFFLYHTGLQSVESSDDSPSVHSDRIPDSFLQRSQRGSSNELAIRQKPGSGKGKK